MKNKGLQLFMVFSIIGFIVTGQNVQFTDIADLPSARRGVGTANDSESIYLANGGGSNYAGQSEVFKYNIAMDSWSTLTNLTLEKQWLSAAIVGNNLYIFNGDLIDGGLNENLEVVDLDTGSITFASVNPQPAHNGGVAVWNNKIYSFGGYVGSSNYSDKLLEFDPTYNTWTELAPMPISLETKGEIIDGKLYVFGGFNGTTSSRIDIYDISTNTWEIELTMPVGVSANSTAIIGSRIYLVGDYTDLTFLAYFETIDYSFHILQSNLNPRKHCGAEGVNGKLYALGGSTTSSVLASAQVSNNLLSIIDYDLQEDLLISPNPASDILSWNLELNSVIVTDILGNILIEYNGNNNELDVSNFEEGLYFFIGQKNDKKYVLKWLKE